jgi:ribosome-associated protein
MDPLRVNSRLLLPASELRADFARAGGPGGQNVNKVASKVQLRFDVQNSRVLGEERKRRIRERLAGRLTASGELVLQASRYRSQARNMEDARDRLAQLLREALQTARTRVATRPTRGSKLRRQDAKKQPGALKRSRREQGE